jgi:hypothetical protein
MPDLLLHSLAEFTPLIEALLDAVEARDTLEIGVEYGTLSPRLVARARRLKGAHIGLDPAAKKGAETCFDREFGWLFATPSLSALPHLPPVDAYLIDGDHNHYTVLSELRLIRDRAAAAQRGFPLAILHDVGWPCARRDMYYAPERIPAEFLHPYNYNLGVRPGLPGMGPGGFRGAGAFAFACREGGPRNGVLSAVEDFMAETPDLAFFDIPAIFGLGVLLPGDRADRVEPLLAPWRGNPTLARMEANRLDLFIRVLDFQDGLAHHPQG